VGRVPVFFGEFVAVKGPGPSGNGSGGSGQGGRRVQASFLDFYLHFCRPSSLTLAADLGRFRLNQQGDFAISTFLSYPDICVLCLSPSSAFFRSFGTIFYPPFRLAIARSLDICAPPTRLRESSLPFHYPDYERFRRPIHWPLVYIDTIRSRL